MVIALGLIIYGYIADDNHHLQQIGIALLFLSAYSYAKGFENSFTNFIDKLDNILPPNPSPFGNPMMMAPNIGTPIK